MTIQLLPDGREVKIKLAMGSSPDESVKKTLSFNFFKKNYLMNLFIFFIQCVWRGVPCAHAHVCVVYVNIRVKARGGHQIFSFIIVSR